MSRNRAKAKAPKSHPLGLPPREVCKRIADESMKAIATGSYTLESSDPAETFDLKTNVERLQRFTRYYGPESKVSTWSTPPSANTSLKLTPTRIWAIERSTLDTARDLVQKFGSKPDSPLPDSPLVDDGNSVVGGEGKRAHAVGVLNFASAKNPGGGFLNGARAQEESIARSSTLYQSLTCPIGQRFYTYHHKITAGKNDGFYSHAMIYSPSVLVFRTDTGSWINPYEIDILTSPAVNAGVVWQKRQKALDDGQDVISEADTQDKIRAVMKERMARLLYLFEIQDVRNIVLGSFGTGAFKNSVDMVVDLWAELLVGEEARFGKSFERVVFGVIGHETYLKFADKFGTEAA